MRVLVCGGRNYNDVKRVFAELDGIDAYRRIDAVIHGDASGADRLSEQWASARVRWALAFPADWQKFGRSAGPIRNRIMLVACKPDLVVAFPGGAGTEDMVRRAEQAGIPVKKVGR